MITSLIIIATRIASRSCVHHRTGPVLNNNTIRFFKSFKSHQILQRTGQNFCETIHFLFFSFSSSMRGKCIYVKYIRSILSLTANRRSLSLNVEITTIKTVQTFKMVERILARLPGCLYYVLSRRTVHTHTEHVRRCAICHFRRLIKIFRRLLNYFIKFLQVSHLLTRISPTELYLRECQCQYHDGAARMLVPAAGTQVAILHTCQDMLNQLLYRRFPLVTGVWQTFRK